MASSSAPQVAISPQATLVTATTTMDSTSACQLGIQSPATPAITMTRESAYQPQATTTQSQVTPVTLPRALASTSAPQVAISPQGIPVFVALVYQRTIQRASIQYGSMVRQITIT